MALARALQERATELQTPAERRQQAELDRMLQTAADKVTLVQLTDQAFRCRAAGRTAEHLTHILDVQGVPRFFSPLDRALLRGFQTFGGWLPGVTVPLVKEHMQQETANVVLPAEAELLQPYLAARHREGVRMNLNFLGEAVLGEEEAAQRLEKYLAALQLPEVEVLSVKISTLHSQISPLAREDTLKELCDRLELLYRNAARLGFTRPDGTTVAKFIYLDMEEYRDLQLTAQAFMRTLDRPALKAVSGGIALQAYIPDSAQAQRELQDWARARVAAGGAPITIRIVKGANLEMERVEASLRDWPQAPYKTKRETDANYKRMLRESMRPENLAAVRVGVASHNLFDLAYGLVLAAAANAGERVQFEMLEGMANQQRRALLEQTRHLLLYAPACRKEEFLNAIGYLIRRLDENTGPENFLRHAFKLKVGSPDWEQLERGFRESFTIAISDAPRRAQNRGTERFDAPRPEMKWQEFENEPDTDWSLPENSAWAERGVSFGFRVSGFESLQAHSEITRPATRPTPSPPAEGGEGWGEEGLQNLDSPLSPALSPLVPRGEREESGAVSGIARRKPHVVVHMSHVLVDASWRRTGLAGWLRAAPLQTARAGLEASGLPVDSPITLVAEMEHADPSFPNRQIRLAAYEKAGFVKVDPVQVRYFQPDFRPPPDIDRGGGPQPLPFSLILRRVGREREQTIAGREIRDIVESLYQMYGEGFRANDMAAARSAFQYPGDDAGVRLVSPT